METNYLKTFYRVTRYIHSRWKDKYPTFKIRKEYENYFQTLEEAQASVLATSKDYKLYAMVITELPYGYPCTEEEYLSRWVYRADGSLNGCVSYAELDQRDEFPGLNELGTGDELGRMRIYRGRKPEEVHFQRFLIIVMVIIVSLTSLDHVRYCRLTFKSTTSVNKPRKFYILF